MPALFGYGGMKARLRTQGEARAAGLVQEFEVEWTVPDVRMAGAVGGGGWAWRSGSCRPRRTRTSVVWGIMVVGAMGAAGTVMGVARGRDRVRRAESQAQTLRVHALERSLALRETREGEVGGGLEGSVAAGQYRILRRMGSGASGVIYEAVRISDGLPVAIKLLRAAAAHEAVASDRLRREAEALGLSWHPNVVEVIDHGHVADGTAYLVMELLARGVAVVAPAVEGAPHAARAPARSRCRSATRSPPCTPRASSIATSSRRTSSWPSTATTRRAPSA